MTSENVIETSSLSFSYEKNNPVLEDIGFEVEKGEFLGIVGPNGSGKTTLMRIILGIQKGYTGTVKIFDKKLGVFNEWDKIGYVPQKYARKEQFPATVQELLELNKTPDKPDIEKEEIINLLDIQEFLNQKFMELSGGQQQRVMVAMALIKNPEILILDEPSVGVDIRTQEDFYDFLHKLNKEYGITVILISHDIGMISEHTDKVMLLNNTVCCKGDTEELPELMEIAYGDDFKVFQHMHGGHNH